MKGLNFKITNTTFLVAALVLLVIVILQQIYNLTESFQTKNSRFENFQDTTEALDADDANLDTDFSTEEDATSPTQCPTFEETPWYLKQPVGSIVSRYHGTTLDVAAVIPEQNINSPYIIPIKNPNTNTTPGCLSVNADGTYTTTLCDMNNIGQHWNIKYIKTAQDLANYVPSETIQPDEKYDFCLILSSRNSTKALHYDGGALAVRPIGNYEGQKWLINPTATGKIFPVIETNQYSQFTPEHVPNTVSGVGNLPFSQQSGNGANPPQLAQDISSGQNTQLSAKLDQILNVLQTQGKLGPPSESSFGVKPVSINVKLGGNKGVTSESDLFDSAELFQDINNDSNNYNNLNNSAVNSKAIPACPIPNMDNYINKSGIPCDACANF